MVSVVGDLSVHQWGWWRWIYEMIKMMGWQWAVGEICLLGVHSFYIYITPQCTALPAHSLMWTFSGSHVISLCQAPTTITPRSLSCSPFLLSHFSFGAGPNLIRHRVIYSRRPVCVSFPLCCFCIYLWHKQRCCCCCCCGSAYSVWVWLFLGIGCVFQHSVVRLGTLTLYNWHKKWLTSFFHE